MQRVARFRWWTAANHPHSARSLVRVANIRLPGRRQADPIFCRFLHARPSKEDSVWGHTQILRRVDDHSSVQEENPEPAEKIAASIHPIHKSCSIDSRVVDGWFRRLGRVRMGLPEGGGGMDGVVYEVTLKHGMDVMQARIWVWKEQKPLIALVDDITREVERASCTEIQRPAKKA